MCTIETAVTPYGDNDRVTVHVRGESASDTRHAIIMSFYDGYLLNKWQSNLDNSFSASWVVDGRRGKRKAQIITAAYAN